MDGPNTAGLKLVHRHAQDSTHLDMDNSIEAQFRLIDNQQFRSLKDESYNGINLKSER